MSRHGRAVSAERTPVSPPAPTRLVSLTPRPDGAVLLEEESLADTTAELREEGKPLDILGKTGRIVGYRGAVWIEGKYDGCTFTTEPGWIGPLKFWKAQRYAKRNGIVLAHCNCGLNNGHRNPRECPVHGPGAGC